MFVSSAMCRSALAVCALAFGLGACGGDEGGSGASAGGGQAVSGDDREAASAPAPGGSGVQVVAKDIAFEPAELTIASGPAELTLKNAGAIVHTLVIEGAPRFGKLSVAKGASDTGTLDLAPGTYTAYCDQPGHRAAGMEAKLTVG